MSDEVLNFTDVHPSVMDDAPLPHLPHQEIREFIPRLTLQNAGDELSEMVCQFLGIPFSPVTTSVEAALGAIPDGWWWNVSHHEVRVIPTNSANARSPVMNAARYDSAGRPVDYVAMCWSKREIPIRICEALLKAKYDLPNAFYILASRMDEVNHN